jgi:predicted component of type VI protein secretion system
MLILLHQQQLVAQQLQQAVDTEFINTQDQVVLPSKEKTKWRILHN